MQPDGQVYFDDEDRLPPEDVKRLLEAERAEATKRLLEELLEEARESLERLENEGGHE